MATTLWHACKDNDVERVQSILSNNTDPNKNYRQYCVQDLDINGKSNDYSPLHVACVNGNLEIVKLLVNVPGIDVNCGVHEYTDYCSPLFAAYTRGHREIVKLLLKVDGIDVNDGCYQMCTLHQNYEKCDFPLYYACKIGDYEIVEELLKCKTLDIDKCIYNYDEPIIDGYIIHSELPHDDSDYLIDTSALYAACKRGHLGIVKLLIETGAYIDENCKKVALKMNIDLEKWTKSSTLFTTVNCNLFEKQVFCGDVPIIIEK